MSDLKERVIELNEKFEGVCEALDVYSMRQQMERVSAESLNPKLWDDPEHARALMKELSDLKEDLAEIDKLSSEITALVELSNEDGVTSELKEEVNNIEKRLSKFEFKTFLSGKYDRKNAIVSIHSGQGGTEAMDWASMLFRMYLRYCEKKDWETEVLDETPGEEAGIKSIVFSVTGLYAYGYLKGESGTHRLVRQSPFNADKLRQTSFALVEVLPEFQDVDLPDVEIKDEDLEWQFFRASTQGGQNVQKVSSAVRLIHKPSGIVVTSQTERYQEQNRKYALNLLRAKLWSKLQTEMREEKKSIKGDYVAPSWGTQIRSYVLHPYKMVKDLRTEVESADTESILNGELDEFIEAEIKL